MKEFSVLGLDLALSNTGIAFVDFEARFVVTAPLSLPAFKKDFPGVYSRIRFVKERIKEFVTDYNLDVTLDLISVETALPRGQWAAGSFGLCSVVIDCLEEITNAGIIMYHPTYLGFLHEAKSYKKRSSVKLAKAIIEEEQLNVFTNYSSRINHNEAEAFLFAYAGAIQLGFKPAVYNKKFKVKKGKIYRNLKGATDG